MSLGGRVCREVLDCYFNGTSITAPSNIFVSLHTADPGEDGQGAGEVSGGSYARVSTAPANWSAAAGADPAALANSTSIDFPTPTASWGTVTHFGLWTSLAGTTEADFVGGSALTTPRTIGSGEDANFAIGDLDATLD